MKTATSSRSLQSDSRRDRMRRFVARFVLLCFATCGVGAYFAVSLPENLLTEENSREAPGEMKWPEVFGHRCRLSHFLPKPAGALLPGHISAVSIANLLPPEAERSSLPAHSLGAGISMRC